MTKIVCRTDYKLSLSNVDRQKIYNKKDIKYVDKIIDYFSDDKKRMLNMLDYFTGKINKHEDYNLILENGNYATKEELEKRKKYINKQFEKSNIWQVVLSVDKKLVDDNITWRDMELKLAKEILPKFFKSMGFEDPKNMCYEFSLHTNTKHPHFHISFMEKKPNTLNKKNKLIYRRYGKIPQEAIDFLKNEVVLSIERNNHFTPLATNINKDIDEFKKYFSPNTKNFILYDKRNILLEEKIYNLGKLLDERNNSYNGKIKYNSLKDEEIKKLTNEIKDDIFNSYEELDITKSSFNKSISDMNQYLKNIYKENHISQNKVDLSYSQNKENYLNNFILNAIVNHARYNYKNKEIITSKEIIQSIAHKNYLRNKKLDRKTIVKNHMNKIHTNKQFIYNAIKSINREMDEAAELFYQMNNNKEYYK